MNKKVKVGILIDRNDIDSLSYEIIEWLKKNEHRYKIYFLDQNLKKNFFYQKVMSIILGLRFIYLINSIFFKILLYIEKKFILKDPIYKKIFKNSNYSIVKKNLIKLKPIENNSNFFLEFDNQSINKVKKIKLDFIIRLGSKILKGKILKSSKKGIISFHHGDNQIFRGGPAGFWETYFGINNSGFIIQQLTNKLDAGNIIFRGNFKTEPYFLKNQINLRLRSNYYLKKILENYYTNRKFYFRKKYKVSEKIFKNPNCFQVVNYFLKLVYRKLFVMKKIHRWNIAVFKGNFEKIDHKKSIITEKSNEYFLADPFLYRHGKEYYIFAEKFVYSENKGKIVAFKYKNNSLKELGTVISEKFHLSFPFIFRFKNRIYLIPDSSSNKDIRLYVSEKFPLKWKLQKIILKNVSATDTMVYKLDKDWQIITNLNPNKTDDLNSELFLFHSSDPVNKKWKSFKNNPIIINYLHARNGGIIFKDSKIYRVHQKHKFNDYGNSIGVEEIFFSKKKNYIYKKNSKFKLKFLKQIQKCHHLNSDGELSVYDYV